ncbi:MAG: cupredoxin family protein [Burkholderiales bacterium]|nr:cupredoxin family protein [Burkholderiales bacterium]
MTSIKFRSLPALGLAALLAFSASGSWAAGTHAGGHGHSDHHASMETPYGKPGDAAKARRTITVEMSDNMRFTPSEIKAKKGETIRFVIRNSGQLRHEFSLGTQQELEEHYEQMKKFPDMVHDEPNKISLEPGQQGEVIWQFTRSGKVDFACLHVGHYEAGMKGQVSVGK